MVSLKTSFRFIKYIPSIMHCYIRLKTHVSWIHVYFHKNRTFVSLNTRKIEAPNLKWPSIFYAFEQSFLTKSHVRTEKIFTRYIFFTGSNTILRQFTFSAWIRVGAVITRPTERPSLIRTPRRNVRVRKCTRIRPGNFGSFRLRPFRNRFRTVSIVENHKH